MTTAYLLSDKPFILEKIPSELAEIYPIEEALRILGFDQKSEYGLQKKTWGPLEVAAGPWVGCWQLIFSSKLRGERVLHFPYQICVPNNAMPIVILSIIYEAWESWFRGAETPEDLQLGKEFSERNWEAIQKELANRPKLWVEREFFRFCVNYLEKQFDWPEEDCEIAFTYADGQLRMRVRDIEVHCPARGKFNGVLTFSGRKFFRKLPKRFIDESILIQYVGENKATVSSQILPAEWIENTFSQDSTREIS